MYSSIAVAQKQNKILVGQFCRPLLIDVSQGEKTILNLETCNIIKKALQFPEKLWPFFTKIKYSTKFYDIREKKEGFSNQIIELGFLESLVQEKKNLLHFNHLFSLSQQRPGVINRIIACCPL